MKYKYNECIFDEEAVMLNRMTERVNASRHTLRCREGAGHENPSKGVFSWSAWCRKGPVDVISCSMWCMKGEKTPTLVSFRARRVVGMKGADRKNTPEFATMAYSVRRHASGM